jgi:hypothetical protein
MVDTPAEVRSPVEVLTAGERLQVLTRTAHWIHVRAPSGQTGWVEIKDTLDADSYEQGGRLSKELSTLPPQAGGHSTALTNLHLLPSRESPVLEQLGENHKLEIYGRRLTPRQTSGGESAGPVRTDAWYLVRDGPKAGWVLGRLVDLDPPGAISAYAQGVNMVSWLVLTSVPDGDRSVPEYLVADRIGSQECDFNHIRVFTWWKKHQEYVTAYVEGNVNGYFPIEVASLDGVPHFRLRLIDEDGRKFQKVYGMFDTIVRPLGRVEGWESGAQPAKTASHRRRG